MKKMIDLIMGFLGKAPRAPVNPNKIGGSYMAPDGRKGHEGETRWIHTQH